MPGRGALASPIARAARYFYLRGEMEDHTESHAAIRVFVLVGIQRNRLGSIESCISYRVLRDERHGSRCYFRALPLANDRNGL